jgi:DNA-binding NarL/FixJ family response regulator
MWREVRSAVSPYIGTRKQIHDAFRARLGADGYEAMLAELVVRAPMSVDEARNLALGRAPEPGSPEFQTGDAKWNRLSAREQEVARLIAEGLSNREIATRLFVSLRTAEGHVFRLTTKLELSNRTAVAALVHQLPDDPG